MSEPSLLLVDGEELVRAPLAHYLRECGYRVLEAVNAKEALAILYEGSQIVDIMLVDIQTLGEEGFGFAAWVRKNKPGIRVVSAGRCGHGPQSWRALRRRTRRQHEPYGTTNSCWIGSAACSPNVTEPKLKRGDDQAATLAGRQFQRRRDGCNRRKLSWLRSSARGRWARSRQAPRDAGSGKG